MPDKTSDGMRIDQWLDVACLFRTRSDAQRACQSGRIAVNSQPAKANRRLKLADIVEISRPSGRKQRLAVLAFAAAHVARAEARTLYEDLTPPPTPQEIEARRFERLYKAAMTPPHAPDKRQRREIRRFTGRD